MLRPQLLQELLMLRPQPLQELRPLHHLILMDWRNSQLLVLAGSLLARVVLRIVPTGGNIPPPEPIYDNGWGISPSSAAQYSSHDYSDSSVEPQYRAKGKHAGRGDNNKSKGRGNKSYTQPSGKRGRDSRDDNARDVRQKSWNQDGKCIAEAWSKSPHVRLYMRTLLLGALKTLLIDLRSADSNFQKNAKDIPFEKWHENSDTALAHLHKALGMPVRFTVSPHFYYRAAQWPCKNVINMLENNERLDRAQHDLFTTRNPNEFE
jgi:hypothetical protein